MALKGQMGRAILNLSLLALNISFAFHFVPLSISEGTGSRSKTSGPSPIYLKRMEQTYCVVSM